MLKASSWTVAAALVLLAGCDFEGFSIGSATAYQKDFHYTHTLKKGGRLSLENFNGPVELSGWDQETVEISGALYASSPELRDALKVDIQSAPDSLFIRTVRPPAGTRGNYGARYVLRVPRSVELDRVVSSNGKIRIEDITGTVRLRTSNGHVEVVRVRGTVEATTSNGSVGLRDVEGPVTVRTSNGGVKTEDLKGAVDATTSNGSIHAHIARTDPRRPMKLETSNGGIEVSMESGAASDLRASTSNGGITVRLPPGAGVRVRAQTSNSSISTDFDVRREGTNNKHRLEGTIGDGGAMIELASSNGGIRLLKR
ncbi:MAG: DUF4097 family beta strand repeat-containing protein [Bryobacteraceae bacterium]